MTASLAKWMGMSGKYYLLDVYARPASLILPEHPVVIYAAYLLCDWYPLCIGPPRPSSGRAKKHATHIHVLAAESRKEQREITADILAAHPEGGGGR